MKFPGCLKLEIIKPIDCSWDQAGSRMRALSRTVGQALTETQRELYPQLSGALQACRERDSKRATELKKQAWSRSRKVFKRHWNAALVSHGEFKKLSEEDKSITPVLDEVAAATEVMLQSRWEGEHFKDLLRGKSSVPSWFGDEPVFTTARTCSIGGKPDEAVLAFPLFGAGKKATRFAVAPCGGSARAQWAKMVRDYSSRGKVVELERAAKGKDKVEKERALFTLEELKTIKLGQVGIEYNKRKRKWYALISWTQHRQDLDVDGQVAAANFGANTFLQVVAENGETFEDPGTDIIAQRSRFGATRRSIARSQRFFGTGSKGRGRKRRELPLTKRQGAEQRWTQTRIRQTAAALIRWCLRHNVGTLLLEDLKGIRDAFEDATHGQAHEQIKRYVHSWPWRETQMAIEREAVESGKVQVEYKKAGFDSQQCPVCAHVDEKNVKIQDRSGIAPDRIVPNPAGGAPLRYRQIARMSWFECVNCGTKGKGDIVTCCNYLADAGCEHPLHKMQEKSRKRLSRAVRGSSAKTQTQKRTSREPPSKSAKSKGSKRV